MDWHVDQKFTDEVFGGLEYSGRNLKVPLSRLNNNGNLVQETQDAKEQQSRDVPVLDTPPVVCVTHRVFV